jgi:hypothetical protein
MTSVLLRPDGTLSDFVDGAGFFRFREREWQTVVDAGFIGASVYITGAFGVSRACIEAAWNVGLVLSPNVERSPSLFLGGYNSGKWLAQEGIRELLNLGFQGEAHVFASGVDFSVTPSQFPAIDDAHKGWLDEFEKVDWQWPGTYTPKNYMQRLPYLDWWPERAGRWHWGGDNSGINNQPIYEFADFKQWYGHKPEVYGPRHDVGPIPAGLDENTHVARPIKFWTGYGSDPITPQEDDMLPEQAQQLANCEQFIGEIYKILSVPVAEIPNDLGMQWNLIMMLDHVVYKDHLVNRIANAVAAKLPQDQTSGLTEAQIVDAVKLALRQGTG